MAYANGFNGDVIQLNYILQTLEEKTYAIPGVTCDDNLSVSLNGESFSYWIRSAASGEINQNLGAQVSFQTTGTKRVDKSFTKAATIKDVIPAVNYQTVSADVVGDRVILNTITVANKLNELFVDTALDNAVGSAQGAVWDGSPDTVYAYVLALRAAFRKANEAHNVEPTACFVSSDVYSAMLAKNIIIFKDGKRFGELLGFAVIEVPHLDDKSFIMLNAKGMIDARNINNLMVTDATPAGYPNGTLIAGEMGYF